MQKAVVISSAPPHGHGPSQPISPANALRCKRICCFFGSSPRLRITMSAQHETVSNGVLRSRPTFDDALFRTLVELSADTVFLIDLGTEECIYVSPAVV